MSKWETKDWFISPFDYEKEVTSKFNFAKKIKFHDVTLRDGEQQAALVFRKDEKIRIAEQLAEVGIDRIEAGMPAVSKEDELAIREIVKRNLGPEIFAFCRCIVDDVKMAADCGVTGVVIEIPGSQHVIEKAYGWSIDKAMELSIQATSAAKELGLYTVFFTIDMTRADLNWIFKLIDKVATEGHMDALTMTDSVGGLSPHAAGYLAAEIKKKIKKPLELHFHNDFGCAGANTVMALAAGADVVHASISGFGERAGMTSYEEVVMMLETMYGMKLNINFSKLCETSKMVQDMLGVTLSPTKPIVGDGLFTIESGIPVSWLKRLIVTGDMLELYPFHWDFVGHEGPKVVLGKMSGTPSVENWLARLGIDATEEQVIDILAKVKEKAIDKKNLLDEDEFKEIVRKVLKK
jgi:isopropylmalate/homocitrate/citramalate synthase